MDTKRNQIAQSLKEAGLNSKMVTVKEERGGLSWSFTLTIRNCEVDIEKVKGIANKFTSIDRCEHSGEILSGGNTYIFIRASEAVAEKWGISPYRSL